MLLNFPDIAENEKEIIQKATLASILPVSYGQREIKVSEIMPQKMIAFDSNAKLFKFDYHDYKKISVCEVNQIATPGYDCEHANLMRYPGLIHGGLYRFTISTDSSTLKNNFDLKITTSYSKNGEEKYAPIFKCEEMAPFVPLEKDKIYNCEFEVQFDVIDGKCNEGLQDIVVNVEYTGTEGNIKDVNITRLYRFEIVD